jgi:two-component system OmpR family sensor kinase/two-component system sensor histidine kinase QseC
MATPDPLHPDAAPWLAATAAAPLPAPGIPPPAMPGAPPAAGRWRVGRSLRARLLLSLLAVLVVSAVAMGSSVYWSVLRQTESLFDYQLRQMALSMRDQGYVAPEDARALADGQLDFVVQIWSQDGRVVYAARREIQPPARAVIGFAEIPSGGEVWRTFGVIARDRVIQVAQPVRIRHDRAAQAALRSVVPLLAVAPALALVVGWLVSRSLAPLQRLAGEVRARETASLESLSAEGLPDEVRPLVESLNALLDRLGQALAAQRHFVGDAAHELRSPLTALKLQVQVLRRATDEATRDQAAQALTAGVDRATRLVEQLLALARSEAAPARETGPPRPLAEIVRQAMADVAPLAAARGTVLELEAPENDGPVIARGAADVAVLARNLIDNAVRYSPDGGRVAVRVEGAHGGMALQVDDDGPGIPPADRELVFDRFVRRENAAGQTGSGLGLAIVRQVALQQGAQVRLDDSPLGGLRVRVEWNSAPPPPS